MFSRRTVLTGGFATAAVATTSPINVAFANSAPSTPMHPAIKVSELFHDRKFDSDVLLGIAEVQSKDSGMSILVNSGSHDVREAAKSFTDFGYRVFRKQLGDRMPMGMVIGFDPDKVEEGYSRITIITNASQTASELPMEIRDSDLSTEDSRRAFATELVSNMKAAIRAEIVPLITKDR